MLNSGGSWIKTAEVKEGDKVQFKDEGSWQENTKFPYPDGNPKMDFVITVMHNAEDKNMRLNKTNRDVMAVAYGKDTSKWVGKVAVIQKMKALVAGKQMEVIVLEAAPNDQGEPVEDIDVPF